MESLSTTISHTLCHSDALQYKNYPKEKLKLARKLFDIYNQDVFDGCLPVDMAITWSSRLTKTAGMCVMSYTKEGIRTARIVLSIKVLDTACRLRDTLIHELCHAAVFLITRVSKGGHGPYWKHWTLKAMLKFPELPFISSSHSYKINTKFVYTCKDCGYSIGRHTQSLDTVIKVCGHCLGTFEVSKRKTLSAKVEQYPEKTKP